MSLTEILEELPKLTEEVDKEEAIDEGIRSLNEEPIITWDELDQQIQRKHGWKYR